MSDENNSEFFVGFALLSDQEKMEVVAGSPLIVLGEVAMHDVELVVQELEDIPEPVRGILQNAWGEDFATNTARPSPGSSIEGILYQLTPEQQARVSDWELEELGWMVPHKVKVEHKDGTFSDAYTLGIPEAMSFRRHTDKSIEKPIEKIREIVGAQK